MTKRHGAHAARRAVAALLFAMLSGTGIASAGTGPHPLTVRGGFVNDIGAAFCNLLTAKPGTGTPPGSVTASCTGGTLYDGGWTGHTITHVAATIHLNGDMAGSFDEWFYGIFTGDESYGGIHWKGTFSIDGATGGFQGASTIVAGTCAFAGSTGHVTYTGDEVNGGYVATWYHRGSASSAPCNPFIFRGLPRAESVWRSA